MAVVKLGSKVKTNLAGTIRYVINPIKNGGGRLVYASYSHERHDANMLAEPMIHDLERCANGLRANGVLALHLKHSFSPDENVTAEQVHELGVMLAEAVTSGDYKYVVSTHTWTGIICTTTSSSVRRTEDLEGRCALPAGASTNGVLSATNCAVARD